MKMFDALLIKRLTDTAILPTYAHNTDSGMDLYYDGEDVILFPTRIIEGELLSSGPGYEFYEQNYSKNADIFSTGISIQLPPNTEAQIRSRSGLAYKHSIVVTNSPGTVDEGYTGEIKVLLTNHGFNNYLVKRGDKIAQMVICPVIRPNVIEVDSLDKSDRGKNGFGSTGK